MNLIPYNDDFERAVIVGVLQDPMLLPRITEFIEPADFYKENHKEIFKAISSTAPDNLDSLTIEDKLRSNEGALTYFRELVQDSEKILPSLSNIMFYAETIKGKSKLRAGIDLGREITAVCYAPTSDPDEAIQQLEQMFAQFLQARVLDNKLESTTESFKKFIEGLNTRATKVEGVKSGFIEVDLMLQRMEGLIVLAARPSMGKTAFAINIARNIAATRPVLFFSLEQSKEQVFERLLAAEAEVDLEDIRSGAFLADKKSMESIQDANYRLEHVTDNIHIDDKAQVPASYISSVSRQKRYEWGDLGLIVVDYLQIMRHTSSGNKTDQIGDTVNELRALGKELDCPIILLSQLSRNNEQRTEGKVKNRRPELTDLRGSGDIEQSADVVIFLYRDSYYGTPTTDTDVAEIIIKKNRNGRQGIVLLDWESAYVKFKNPNVRRR